MANKGDTEHSTVLVFAECLPKYSLRLKDVWSDLVNMRDTLVIQTCIASSNFSLIDFKVRLIASLQAIVWLGAGRNKGAYSLFVCLSNSCTMMITRLIRLTNSCADSMKVEEEEEEEEVKVEEEVEEEVEDEKMDVEATRAGISKPSNKNCMSVMKGEKATDALEASLCLRVMAASR